MIEQGIRHEIHIYRYSLKFDCSMLAQHTQLNYRLYTDSRSNPPR